MEDKGSQDTKTPNFLAKKKLSSRNLIRAGRNWRPAWQRSIVSGPIVVQRDANVRPKWSNYKDLHGIGAINMTAKGGEIFEDFLYW